MYSLGRALKLTLACTLIVNSSSLFGNAYIVNNTNNDGPGSLRQAISAANTHIGPDVILFNIPKADKNFDTNLGVWTIKPTIYLPIIVDAGLVIDGGSQAQYIGNDTNPFGPEVQLDGSLLSFGNGLSVKADGVEIIELTINRFLSYDGILFERVGSGRVAGCYIGTDPLGMNAVGNSSGIWLSHCHNIVIMPKDGKPNLISGNPYVGICIGDSSHHNQVIGNLIGLNRTGDAAIGNGLTNNYGGVRISDRSDSNLVFRNTIGGNKYSGVNIFYSSGNKIIENYIGTDMIWSKNFGNIGAGIGLNSGSLTSLEYRTTGNEMLENYIGNNGVCGIYIADMITFGNRISRNRISSDLNGGIVLTNYANKSIARPVIETVTAMQVTGHAGASQIIEVFCDEKFEGKIFLGSGTSDINGYFSVSLLAPLSLPFVTATATDTEGNTSSFSAPVSTKIDAGNNHDKPRFFALEQNYPNPFNPSTTITFRIKEKCTVLLQVYDVRGRIVSTIIDEEIDEGEHSLIYNARDLVAGIYFIRLGVKDFSETRKMILIQ